jgi:hypothetical protein
MTTMKRLIQLQDAARAARRAFLDFEPPSTSADERAFTRIHVRSLKADRAYSRYLAAYMAEHNVGQELYAQIEAARAARAA